MPTLADPAFKSANHLLDVNVNVSSNTRMIRATADKPKQNSKEYGIAELAAEFGTTARSLRFYEEKRLLRPRREGTKRYYSSADRVRLRLILRGKRLGLSLAESQEIIDLYDARFGSRKQLEVLLKRLSERREQLEQKARDIETTLQDLDAVRQQCETALRKL